MTPLSRDPAKRQTQLDNLQRGSTHALGGRPVEHGARARMTEAELQPKTAAIFTRLAEDAPVREVGSLPSADVMAVKMLAEVLVRLDRIAAYLDRHGWQDQKGNPRPVLDYERRLRDQALDLMRELAMTPKSRAALGLDLTRTQAIHNSLESFAGDDGSEAGR